VVVREAVEFAKKSRRVGAALVLKLADYGVKGLCRGFAGGAAGEALAVLQLAGQVTHGVDEPGHFRARGEPSEGGAGPGRLRVGACRRGAVSARWRRWYLHRQRRRRVYGGLYRRCY
jgi:hypothetical protein